MNHDAQLDTVCPNNHNMTVVFTREEFEGALKTGDLEIGSHFPISIAQLLSDGISARSMRGGRLSRRSRAQQGSNKILMLEITGDSCGRHGAVALWCEDDVLAVV